MRAALWLLALFGVAVAAALFAGNNQGTVTLYWPPYRIDLSLNLVVLLLVGGVVTAYAALRALAHMIAAEASHALQDSATRESHLQDALQEAPLRGTVNEQEMREGAQMRAARWSLDDRDANAALDRLAALPQGAARRTLSLRIKLKATRLA